MTIQEAANEILIERGKPMTSRELARIALEGGLVSSTAQDPVQSHAQTIEKNIRDDIYNRPKLIFIHSSQGRLIGLPEWKSDEPKMVTSKSSALIEINAKIPVELFEKIKLAEQAKLKDDIDGTVAMLLSKGLAAVANDIKKRLLQQLDSFEDL
ncbi:MAG: hypothetical protein JRI85_06330 [Deltaproteobacteria bacterium]|nr:hypothetical protein [Deltaproteobacteria bacterium]